jgi:hypothetical protein
MTFTEGQVWQLQTGYLKIIRLGKSLVEYKLLRKPDQKAVQSQMARPEVVEQFLKSAKARLQ